MRNDRAHRTNGAIAMANRTPPSYPMDLLLLQVQVQVQIRSDQLSQSSPVQHSPAQHSEKAGQRLSLPVKSQTIKEQIFFYLTIFIFNH
jgi:hypothetical protein